VRALREGYALALLVDRPAEAGSGVDISFFGRECHVPSGAARLALRERVPVVAVCAVRVSPASAAVRLQADFDIDLPDTGDAGEDVRRLTERVFAAHEEFIKKHSDQWYMFREMWPGRAGCRAK
jgi:lauroyl/myristoyl acyltransferase